MSKPYRHGGRPSAVGPPAAGLIVDDVFLPLVHCEPSDTPKARTCRGRRCGP